MIHDFFLGKWARKSLFRLIALAAIFYIWHVWAFFIILKGGQKDQNQYQPNGNTSCG